MEGGEKGERWLRKYKEKHRINWPTVPTGSPYWYDEPFEAYNVSYLPFYLLLDPERELIAVDPRGARLDRILGDLFE